MQTTEKTLENITSVTEGVAKKVLCDESVVMPLFNAACCLATTLCRINPKKLYKHMDKEGIDCEYDEYISGIGDSIGVIKAIQEVILGITNDSLDTGLDSDGLCDMVSKLLEIQKMVEIK
jgi:hypothetical protein